MNEKIEVMKAFVKVVFKDIEPDYVKGRIDYIEKVLTDNIATVMINKGFSVEVQVMRNSKLKFFIDSGTFNTEEEEHDKTDQPTEEGGRDD
jgi:hypothetical protein